MRQTGMTPEKREKERQRAKAKYYRLREEGLCSRCGKHAPENGKANCEECLKSMRIERRAGIVPYNSYPPGCFLERVLALSGLGINALAATTGIPLHRVYQWRSRKPTPQEALTLKEKLLNQQTK